MCESYEKKSGDQRGFNVPGGTQNAVMLVEGSPFFRGKRVLFGNVIGFTKFAEYMLVADVGFFSSILSWGRMWLMGDAVHFGEELT